MLVKTILMPGREVFWRKSFSTAGNKDEIMCPAEKCEAYEC